MAGESETIDVPFKAAYIVQKFNEWKGNRSVADSNWKEIESYKYATDTSTLKSNAPDADHTTHIPITLEIAQDLHALLMKISMPHRDWFDFDPDDREAAKIETKLALEAYLKNRHKLSKFRKTISMLVDDMIDKGNCFPQVVFVDETKGGEEGKSGYVGPALRRISPWDIVFNPTAPSFKESPKIIRESVSLGEFAKRAEKFNWNPEAVKRVMTTRSGVHTANTTGSTNDKDESYTGGYGTREMYLLSGTVDLLWFYGDLFDLDTMTLSSDMMIVISDGESVLLEEPINTWDGKPHIFQGVWQRRTDNLWGMGPLDNIIGLNYQINHRENSKSTGLDKTIYPDRVYQGDVEEIYDADTGQTTYLAPEGGGVQDLAPDTSFLSAIPEIDRLEEHARKAVGLPSDLVGFRSAGEKTFGEVTQLQAGAMRPFIDKAADFEADVLEPILSAEVELARKHMDATVTVPAAREGGFTPFINITPETMKVQGTWTPMGSSRFDRKNQILSSLSQLSSTPLMEIARPHISGKGATELLGELMELEGTDFFKEFAQIIEGAEAVKLSQMAEKEIAASSTEATTDEVDLGREITANEADTVESASVPVE